jgi:hypothetical protein
MQSQRRGCPSPGCSSLSTDGPDSTYAYAARAFVFDWDEPNKACVLLPGADSNFRSHHQRTPTPSSAPTISGLTTTRERNPSLHVTEHRGFTPRRRPSASTIASRLDHQTGNGLPGLEMRLKLPVELIGLIGLEGVQVGPRRRTKQMQMQPQFLNRDARWGRSTVLSSLRTT